MHDTLAARLRRVLARTRASFERLEALRCAARSRRASRRPGVHGPAQA